MKMATGNSVLKDSTQAAAEAWTQAVDLLGSEPSLVICAANAAYDVEVLRQQLVMLAPSSCVVAGASSCLGAMNERGMHSGDDSGLSLMVFHDHQGDFGAGLAELGIDPIAAAQAAVLQAIDNAGRSGELPDLIWLCSAPGQEELVLDGIASVVGTNVPVVGGSSGDNTISGEWWQFSGEDSARQGVLLVVFYPSCQLGVSFHSGYAPSQFSGIATSAKGRMLYTIDHEPAAVVYNRWTRGLIEEQAEGGNILAKSTFHPLGLEVGHIENIPYFSLCHPDQVHEGGAVSLFSNVKEGDQLTLMEGTPESLTRRAGSVIQGLVTRKSWHTSQLTGALVVYCAGCMLGVRARMDEVVLGIHKAMGAAPFQGVFTFGEQGCFIDGVNRHANLMIAVVVFSNEGE